MRVRRYCPECLTARDFTVSPAGGFPPLDPDGMESAQLACEKCGHPFSAAFDGIAGAEGVERCAFCGKRAFFLQKDFDQRLGCLFLGASLALALFVGARAGWIWFTPVLLATVVVDWIVAARIRPVTICYRCDAEYRDLPVNPRHRGYDPHVAERDAGTKTVRRMR